MTWDDRPRGLLRVIFDLDGTLSLLGDRRRFLLTRPIDWAAFFEACDQDEPNPPMIAAAHAFADAGYHVEIWTGRSDVVRAKTVAWLTRFKLHDLPLHMRPEGDHRPDTVLKRDWLMQLPELPLLVFEDRPSVVEMWRAAGVTCAQMPEYV